MCNWRSKSISAILNRPAQIRASAVSFATHKTMDYEIGDWGFGIRSAQRVRTSMAQYVVSGFSRTVIAVAQGFSPACCLRGWKHRFRKQGRSAWQNTSPALLLRALALGPSLVLAEVAGSRVLPTVAVTPPSLFAPPALPAADPPR